MTDQEQFILDLTSAYADSDVKLKFNSYKHFKESMEIIGRFMCYQFKTMYYVYSTDKIFNLRYEFKQGDIDFYIPIYNTPSTCYFGTFQEGTYFS